MAPSPLPQTSQLQVHIDRRPVGVLAIQGGYDLHADALREVGADPRLVRRADQLAGLAGLILPGGESTTFLRFLARDGFLAALRDWAAVHPVFGTCAGCILLAAQVTHPAQQSLGLVDIAVERNGYGRQRESTILETETMLPGGPLEAVYIRAPRITRIGPDVQVLATREGEPTLVRRQHLLAATFHPELSDDRRIHRYFLAMIEESGASHASSVRS